DRQARSVRAGAAVLLRLHPQQSAARAVRRGRPAGRADRGGAVPIRRNREGGRHSAVPPGAAADRASADSPSRDREARAREGQEPQRRLMRRYVAAVAAWAGPASEAWWPSPFVGRSRTIT